MLILNDEITVITITTCQLLTVHGQLLTVHGQLLTVHGQLLTGHGQITLTPLVWSGVTVILSRRYWASPPNICYRSRYQIWWKITITVTSQRQIHGGGKTLFMTNRWTDERKNRVTTSFLELLIAAKNHRGSLATTEHTAFFLAYVRCFTSHLILILLISSFFQSDKIWLDL